MKKSILILLFFVFSRPELISALVLNLFQELTVLDSDLRQNEVLPLQSSLTVDANRFERVTWSENTVILDVRTAKEYAENHIAGAVLADVKQADFLSEVQTLVPDTMATIALYCRSGKRSKNAAQMLENAGYRHIVELEGGILAWQKQNKPIISGSFEDLQRYKAGMFKANKQFCLKYRYLQIGNAQSDTLYVYFHTSSAAGIDNERQVRQWGLENLVKSLQDNKINAMVLAPQVRPDRRWNEYRPVNGITMSKAMYKLLQQFANDNHIENIVLIGSHAGGTAVWRLLGDYPKLAKRAEINKSYPARNTKLKKALKTPITLIVSNDNEKMMQNTEKVRAMMQGDKRHKVIVREK